MKIESYRLVPVSLLDAARDWFRISFGRCTGRLERSMQASGFLQPVLLWEEHALEIVQGFRRVEAARRIGLESIPAVFVPGSSVEAEVFLLALDLFLSTDAPNPVEQSIILHKLERYLPRDEILGRFLPRLGLDASPVIYRRVRSIRQLPESAQAALADGRIHPASVSYLERFSEAEREPAVALLLGLRPSKSTQKEILEYLHDLTIRDEVTVRTLLNERPVQAILHRTPANLPQQRQAFRQWLKARRFPVLHRIQSAFEQTRKDLGLAGEVELHPPAYHEGDTYEIRFSFRDAEEFSGRLRRLEAAKNRPEILEKLWA